MWSEYNYKKIKNIRNIEMRDYILDEDLTGITIGFNVKNNTDILKIARCINDISNQWTVVSAQFDALYEAV